MTHPSPPEPTIELTNKTTDSFPLNPDEYPAEVWVLKKQHGSIEIREDSSFGSYGQKYYKAPPKLPSDWCPTTRQPKRECWCEKCMGGIPKATIDGGDVAELLEWLRLKKQRVIALGVDEDDKLIERYTLIETLITTITRLQSDRAAAVECIKVCQMFKLNEIVHLKIRQTLAKLTDGGR